MLKDLTSLSGEIAGLTYSVDALTVAIRDVEAVAQALFTCLREGLRLKGLQLPTPRDVEGLRDAVENLTETVEKFRTSWVTREFKRSK